MGDDTSKMLQGLPMEELIGGPLVAAAESQVKLAAAQYDFIRKIGFEEGNVSGNANMLRFQMPRPVETPEGIIAQNVEIQAPLLGLVPIPSLMVEKVDIEFQMEVSAVESVQEKSENNKDTEESKKSLLGGSQTKIHGRISSSRDNTRQSNRSAKYQVKIEARQQQPTEGMSRLIDLLATCTAQASVKKK